MDSVYKVDNMNKHSSSMNNEVVTEQAANLARCWQDGIKHATFKGSSQDFWDNWAKSLPAKTAGSNYVEEVLARMKLLNTDSVLDVGAGTGAMAIPIAERVHTLTALDQSPYMLEVIREKASKRGLKNIATISINWAEVQIGRDIEAHDVVLVSRSLPSQGDIISSLRSIDKAAKRSCYITWKADSRDALEEEICDRLGIQYRPFPDHQLLYNLLCSMGIRADVDIFRITGQSVYHSIDDAFTQIIRSHSFQNEDEKQAIKNMLTEKLEYSKGLYSQKKNNLWALIHWNKIL